MKAVILVGGEGTRLRPLTCGVPKPMVPIVNKPFLEWMIDYLKGYGIEDIILALCYLPDRIQSYFRDGHNFGVRLTYVVEESPLGTAGAVKNVEKYLDDTFLVFNGDVFTDLDLKAMLTFHKEVGAKVSIALTSVEDPTIYGVVETGGKFRVRRFIEKPSWDAVTTNNINAGTYILDPDVLRYIPAKVYYMFEQGLFPSLLRNGEPIYGYSSQGYWIDIGTPEKYLSVHHDILTGKVSGLGNVTRGGIDVGEGCDIHPTAQFKGPIVIGKNCSIAGEVKILGPAVLGEGCTIEEGVTIEGAILWPKARVEKGALVRRCVIGEKARVGEEAWVVDGAILANDVVVGRGNKLERGIKVWPGKRLDANTISF